MRGVRGVADQHVIAVVPSAANDPIEIEPCRTAQMASVRQEASIAEISGKQRFAKGDRLIDVGLVQAVRRPGLLSSLDDDRRELLAELIRMDLKPAVLRFLERKGECGEFLRRAEPNEAALAHLDIRQKFIGLARARLAVDAFRNDDEIRVVELPGIVELVLEALLDVP